MNATATILATMKVTKLQVGGQTYALPEGTTNVNAADVSARFHSYSSYTWDYAGSKDDATMVVVRITHGGMEKAKATLAKKLAKLGGAL